jgi:hypothetical protein
VVDHALAKHIIEAFYEKIIMMFEDLEDGGVMDCSTATRALSHATHAMKTNVSVHIGVKFCVAFVCYRSMGC